MTELAREDFSDYFAAIHGHAPFPWQSRLLARIDTDGRWPSLLDLPTGAGKTSAIDVAVFHLALDAARTTTERRAPRRIVMVVDRRTVVDQAYERAGMISHALSTAPAGILRTVRDRLCALSGTHQPLARAQLRGGMPRDDGWAKRPDQPLVAVSTVDQVGSRILFRGYGVSDVMRPIHAGLLANDALFLLDEVHLSRPFLETLEALAHYRSRSIATLPDRWQFVAMSATPGRAENAFSLAEDDRADPRLLQRLTAKKPATLDLVKVGGNEDARRRRFADECASHVEAAAKPGRRVGVVVNRVATALEIVKLVRARCKDARTYLVTGRMRPLDRTSLDRELIELVGSARTRTADGPPVVVVSTQCIEAGADFDFDALVTECASLDALRQRFGRLNRLGAIDDARGTVLVRSDAVAKDARDPIYGAALAETWRWLDEAPRDFGIDAMRASLPSGDELARMLPAPSRAPVMLPAHLDAWAQTTPIPRPDPDVALWLHGVDRRTDADVQIIWRADVTATLLKAARRAQGASAEEQQRIETAFEELLARIDVCPPSGLEALSVPVWAARAWLAGAASDIADVEGFEPDEPETHRAGSAKACLSWRADASVVIDANEVRPGMTIVVPSSYGGLTDGTWDPSSSAPVLDLGDRARWTQTRRPILRLHPKLATGWAEVPIPANEDDPDLDDRANVDTWLDVMRTMTVEPWVDEVVAALHGQKRRVVIVRFDGVTGDDGFEPAHLALVGRARTGGAAADDAGDVSTEDDGASHTGVEVSLHEHMRGVRSWAGAFAERCGLPTPIVRDLELAARWHDAGKVDPRFQRMLRGGSPLADVAAEPLAKSRIVAPDRAARRRARERAKYPTGARHELASLSLMERAPSMLAEASDRDLVLHLIASHHGWCRPFAPVADDPEPVELVLRTDEGVVTASSAHGHQMLGSGVPERFWRLVERYGWFGLAWLESILRLADHRRSEEEQSRAFAEKESS